MIFTLAAQGCSKQVETGHIMNCNDNHDGQVLIAHVCIFLLGLYIHLKNI